MNKGARILISSLVGLFVVGMHAMLTTLQISPGGFAYGLVAFLVMEIIFGIIGGWHQPPKRGKKIEMKDFIRKYTIPVIITITIVVAVGSEVIRRLQGE